MILPTIDNLGLRGVNLNWCCCVCDEQDESVFYIMFSCVFSWGVWNTICLWVGLVVGLITVRFSWGVWNTICLWVGLVIGLITIRIKSWTWLKIIIKRLKSNHVSNHTFSVFDPIIFLLNWTFDFNSIFKKKKLIFFFLKKIQNRNRFELD